MSVTRWDVVSKGIGAVGRAIGSVVAALLVTSAAAVAQTPASASALSQVATIHGPAHLVELDGTRAYVVHEKTLTIYDVSKPAAPVRLGSQALPEKIWGIRIVGTLLYAAADFYGLAVIDIANPQAPVMRGRIKTPGQAKNVAIIGSTALVADHMSGIDIIDVTDSAKRTVKDSFFLEGYARDVTSVGSLAFAIDAPAGIYTFDLSKPGPVEPVGSQQSAKAPATIEVSRNASGQPDLAVMVGAAQLQIYDLAKPTAPVKAATFQPPGGRPLRVALSGRQAFVADAREGLQVIDLTAPASPVLVATIKTPAPARDVAVNDTLVLVATGTEEDGEVLLLARAR